MAANAKVLLKPEITVISQMLFPSFCFPTTAAGNTTVNLDLTGHLLVTISKPVQSKRLSLEMVQPRQPWTSLKLVLFFSGRNCA